MSLDDSRVFELLTACLAEPEREPREVLKQHGARDQQLICRIEELVHQEIESPVRPHAALRQLQLAASSLWVPPELGMDTIKGLLKLLRQRKFAIDRYEVGEELGRGGAGVVYRAWDRVLHRDVAMKVVEVEDRDESSELLLRFLREAHVTAQLEHPAVVGVNDLGWKDSGHLFFTMDLVRGERLSDLVSRGAGTREVVRAIQRAGEAAAQAHIRGVVHRDITPRNILVDALGAVYLMDWGLARYRGGLLGPEDSMDECLDLKRGFTMTRGFQGTPGYSAPEHVLGEAVAATHSMDVYSLGAVLYFALAGHPPYMESNSPRPSLETLRSRIESGVRAPLSDRVPNELVAICEKAMQRSPLDRYSSVAEFSDDLLAWMEGRTVAAFQGGMAYRARKWVQRNPSLVIASSLSLLVLLVFSIMFIRQLDSKNKLVRAKGESTEAALAFIERVFEEAYPLGSSGKDTRLGPVLVVGKQLLSDSSLSPEARHRVGSTLGTVMLSLGMDDESKPLIEAAYEWGEVNHPRKSLERCTAMAAMARLALSLGDSDRCTALMEDVHEMHASLLGRDHPTSIATLVERANLMRDGDADLREALYRESVERSRRVLGVDHLFTVRVERDLGSFLLGVGEWEESGVLLRRCLDWGEVELGPTSAEAIDSRSRWADYLMNIGEFEEATAEFERVVEGAETIYGPRTAATGAYLSLLILAHERSGRFDKAYEMQVELVALGRELYRDSSATNTLSALNNLGIFSYRVGRFDEADRAFAEAYDGYLKHPSQDGRRMVDVIFNWGVNDTLRGEFDLSLTRLLDAVGRLERLGRQSKRQYINALRTLGIHFRMREQYPESEAILLEALDESLELEGSRPPGTLRIVKALSELYEQRGQPRQAADAACMFWMWSANERGESPEGEALWIRLAPQPR